MAKTPKQETATTADGRDWGATLFLPKTEFPMRAGLPLLEPKIIERWQQIGLYEKLRAKAKGRPRFILHDGPPYANGNIHIGHALNKILKDLVTRSQQMLGFDSNYVPGWDCHGLPIEWKIEEEYMAKGKAKPNLKDPAAMTAFRKECRAFAENWMRVQSEEFQRLGVVGDWKNPYSTMTFPAEAQIARELMKFAETGQLYRGSKPVMWSVVEKTALAEAEVEYQDYQSDMVWVKFPVKAAAAVTQHRDAGSTSPIAAQVLTGLAAEATRGPVSIIIWTTTPWTLPGNRAISYHGKIAYGLYEVTKAPDGNWARVGERYVIADKLAAEVMKAAKVEAFERRGVVSADDLSRTTCAHPLAKSGLGGYQFAVPLLDGDHVTDDAGTGFVHTAPGHGREDFDIWTASTRALQARGIDPAIPYTVDENGAFTTDAPGFTGERVITDKGEKGKANDAVIKALAAAGMMVARGRLKHQYPHSWRSKKPVIFRNTPQWFIHMDKEVPFLAEAAKAHRAKRAAAGMAEGHNQPTPKTLREVSLKSIRETQWVPASGENRIAGMIEAKPDWVISRQRAWGVPITVFVRKATGEVLFDPKVNKRIYDAMFKEGADAWFADLDGARFLKPDHDPNDFEKVNDVLDVWFDSGSTHTYVLNDPHFPGLMGITRKVDGGRDTVMYLEGSDQHRGWFHSSLIESSGTRARAPFDVVLTHGFTMDEKGQKMSKSVGNVVAPQDVMKTYGADILRLWVAASDYADDQRLGPDILKGFSETYRKIRNTFRWMLGTLSVVASGTSAGSRPEATAGEAGKMPELERLMLHRLAELAPIVRKAYAEYDYAKVVTSLSQFMNTELSAFYFDIRKDALYCEAPSSPKRLAALACVEEIFRATCIWLAPILSFTTEEAWLARYGDAMKEGSVHLELFPDSLDGWLDEALARKWEKVRRVRSAVTASLEHERAAKRIGSSLEAAVTVAIEEAGVAEALTAEQWAEVFITSRADVRTGKEDMLALNVASGSATGKAHYRADVEPNHGVAGVVVQVAAFPQPGWKKCARSWRFTQDVGSDAAYPELSARDAAAMREIDKRA
ncbi:MAG TPA: isoleucine--tRNA ligase [Hyphomicrobiaceae bacterium]|nr:isoleucine--tRNA ligase [Hyphomicrobiaceae bacterium]